MIESGSADPEDGTLPLRDLVPLLALLVDRAPDAVLEIGTFNGTTTRMMALNRPGATIHTVDLPPGAGPGGEDGRLPEEDHHLIASRRVGEAYRLDPSVANVVQHLGDTATWDFGEAAGPSFFFIVGSQTYEYAKHNTLGCLALRDGRRATLAGHDCNRGHPGLTRWLAEMVEGGYPVRRIRDSSLAFMDVE